jgi:plastocyanin
VRCWVRLKSPAVALLLPVFGASSVPPHSETIKITIEKFSYSPANAMAKVGDSIQWMNEDFEAHTVTDRRSQWDVLVTPHTSSSLVLKKPGIVDYHCRLHSNMRGRITVLSR